MNAWPDTDGRTIARYLGQLRLRCSTSPIYYRQALRTFQEVVIRDQRTPGQLGREVLETWLRECAMHWPMATLLHRARIVNRFLDFLVGEALIVSNPIADLRAEYHAKSDKAIVRSLLAPDPDQALEALRQFPPFGSVLGDLMRNHIALMQARGYRYQTQARWFWRFDRFLQAHPELAGESVSIMLQHWAAARSTANHAAECEKLARALAKAHHHLDPSTKPRRPDPRPAQQVARHWRRPYIYSPEEVRRLLDIALTYPSPRSPLRPISLYTMLVLTYCAGLRLGELARLNLADIDLQVGTITIRARPSRRPSWYRHCRDHPVQRDIRRIRSHRTPDLSPRTRLPAMGDCGRCHRFHRQRACRCLPHQGRPRDQQRGADRRRLPRPHGWFHQPRGRVGRHRRLARLSARGSIVGLLITIAIFGIVWQSSKAVFVRMLDGVAPAITDEIKHAAGHVKGVQNVLDVKARWLGHRLQADIAVQVAPDTAVEDADRLADGLKHEILDHIPALAVATVRVSSRSEPDGDIHRHHAPDPVRIEERSLQAKSPS